eukprot:g40768.t1
MLPYLFHILALISFCYGICLSGFPNLFWPIFLRGQEDGIDPDALSISFLWGLGIQFGLAIMQWLAASLPHKHLIQFGKAQAIMCVFQSISIPFHILLKGTEVITVFSMIHEVGFITLAYFFIYYSFLHPEQVRDSEELEKLMDAQMEPYTDYSA